MKKLSALLLAAAFTAAVFSGCKQEEVEEVTVQNVGMITGTGAVGIVDRFAGVVVSEAETTVEKSETAEIDEILVKAGDTVRKGQTLFTYDSTAMEFTVEQGKLDLERKQLTLQSQIEDKAKLEEEKAKAKEDQQLAYSLEIRELEAEIQESEYNIRLKEQEIQKNEAALKETSVQAPVAGRIQKINKDGGFDDYGRPLPFMTIIEDGAWRVQGYVNEANAAALSEGTPVLLRSRVNDDSWRGAVSMIDWENGRSSGSGDMYLYDMAETAANPGASSQYPFYVELEDTEGLMLGQHVYIEPDYGQDVIEDANRMMLPVYYIVDPDAEPFVYAMGADEKLEKRMLTLGESDEFMETVEIVSGLTPDDYIAFPDEGMKEGMHCTIYDPAADFNDDGAGILPGFDGEMPEFEGEEGFFEEGMEIMPEFEGEEDIFEDGAELMPAIEGEEGMFDNEIEVVPDKTE